MFYKNMEQITVEADDTVGCIRIMQFSSGGNLPDDAITIAPEQVDGLVKWLQEAKACVDNSNSSE